VVQIPGEIKKGPIDAVVLDPVSVPSHHGPDLQTVMPHISITTMAMIVPTTMMHMHALQITTKKPVNRERVIDLIKNHRVWDLSKRRWELKVLLN